jgi:hypothetical protein
MVVAGVLAAPSMAEPDAPASPPRKCADTSERFPDLTVKSCSRACPAGTELSFSVVELKGCFVRHRRGGAVFHVRRSAAKGGFGDGSVTLNGLRMVPEEGAGRFDVKPPEEEGGKGHLRMAKYLARAAGLHGRLFGAHCCSIEIPAAGQGDEIPVFKVPAPAGDTWYGLDVGGDLTFALGWDKESDEPEDDKHFVRVDASLNLPKIFKAAPTGGDAGDASGIAGAFGGRVDDDGWKLGGKIAVKNAWIGGLKLNDLCLSYAHSADTACAYEAGKDRIFSCAGGDAKGPRWDGTVEVAFPSPAKEDRAIGVTAGLIDGDFSYVGGYAGGLDLPISAGVQLDKLGGGICITPPPFQFTALVGLKIGTQGSKLFDFNGNLTYVNNTPWEVKLRGTLEREGRPIANGGIDYKAGRSFDFDVRAEMYFPRRDDPEEEKNNALLSLEGGIAGWMEYDPFKLNVAGDVKICALNLACAMGEAVVSTKGVGGCIKLTSVPYPVLVQTADSSWDNLYLGEWEWQLRYVDVSAGAAYPWGGEVQTFASSCDLASVHETRTFARAAQASDHSTLELPAHLPAATIVVKGAHGPPRLEVTSPDGTVLAPAQAAEFNTGHYDYIEDADHATSSIVIAKPAGGTWRVRDTHGATVLSAEVAKANVPPSILAKVGHPGHDPYSRVLAFAYVPEPHHTIQFVEVSDNGVVHDIGPAHGHACGHHVDDDRPHTAYGTPPATHCGTLHFVPGEGTAGTRKILAIVSEHGIPAHEIEVATYHAPSEALAAPIHGLRLERHGEAVTAHWKAPEHAHHRSKTVQYNVVLKTEDGLCETVVALRDHRTATFNAIPPTSRVTVTVTGLRDDEGHGHSQTAHLRAADHIPEAGRV